MFTNLLYVLFLFLAAWLTADFLSGVYHWFQDRYMSVDSRFKWVRALAADNDLHHEKPTAMTVGSYINTIGSSLAAAMPVLILLFVCLDAGPLKQYLMLTVALLSVANLVHRLAHTPSTKLAGWVVALQKVGFFISADQHDMHHRDWETRKLIGKTQAKHRYCAMSNWVNPLLDRIAFFDTAERLLALIGVHPLPTHPQE